MFSRKQTWRRIKSLNRGIPEQVDIDDDNCVEVEGEGTITKMLSENRDSFTKSPPLNTPSPIKKLRSALSMTNLTDLEKANKPVDHRVLRFSSKVHVCLIPTRKDLKSSHDDMYWKPEDYSTFKIEAVAELKATLQALGLTAKQAIATLYQPSEADRFEDEALVAGLVVPSRPIPDKLIFEAEDYESDWKELKVFNNDDDENVTLDTKFITGIKTDVEMNHPNGDVMTTSMGDINLPKRTPAGSSNQQTAWEVAWVKPSQSQSASTTSASASSSVKKQPQQQTTITTGGRQQHSLSQ